MNGPDERHNVLLGVTDPHVALLYSDALGQQGHTVRVAHSSEEANRAIEQEVFDVLILETALGGKQAGLDLARAVLANTLRPEVVVLADFPNVAHAVSIAKAGAYDYLCAPLSVAQLVSVVEAAGGLAHTRRTTPAETRIDEIESAFLESKVPAVQEMAALARMVASNSDANALILGESGVGKDVVARLIHSLSGQSRAALVTVNLLDVAPELLEERLFGTAEPDGSFVDGPSTRHGSLANARGGTLVLRELSELPTSLGPAILQVIEGGSFRPIDCHTDVPFQARVLATTERDISALVDDQSFYPALFYRLASVMIRVPPLRERAEDLPRLASAILAQVARDAGRWEMRFAPDALEMISAYPWPGNIREMRNVLTKLTLLHEQDLISADAVTSVVGAPVQRVSVTAPKRITRNPGRQKASTMPAPKISGVIAAALDEPSRAERERIEEALASCDGHRERAAQLLGMSRTTLWTRMRLLGIDLERISKSSAR
ncbi:MAG: sigma-54-dependent Fis family transcriptional regulator [Deltaproteobacteria bacterium]|nr:sigma-54-dependent Fis family transcriptional regulator [Deltaproteobacteria bacterium]